MSAKRLVPDSRSPSSAACTLSVSSAGTACASAQAVWELLGPGFAEVSRWSSLNLISRPLPHDERSVDGAPAGRAVETPLGRFEERISAYDPVQRVLSFTVEGDLERAGLESAMDTWSVIETGAQSCRIQVDCAVTIRRDSSTGPAEVRERINGILEQMIRELAFFAVNGSALT